jgi:hypothetical protein
MKPENSAKIKYGIWGLICGAIVTIIIGFAWGGWSTAGTTKQVAEKAVLANDAAICEAQFKAQPNYTDKLKEFEKVSSWERPKFIEKGGWDKMPGQKEAQYSVSQACADRLHLLAKK